VSQVLRDYQVTGLERTREALRVLKAAQRPQRVLLVAPTGAGKTTIAAKMIEGVAVRGGKALFIAHRKELVDQCSQRLDGAGVDHSIIMARSSRAAPWSPVSVASVPTLARRLSFRPEASLLIIDEAHHARASTYGAILAAYAGVPVVGLTATPWRLDNKGLGELFEETVVVSTPAKLIEQGHLVPYSGFAYDAPDLARVRKSKGDFDKVQLEIAMSKSRIVGNIVEQWQVHCAGKRTVLFAVSVAHSKEMVDRFKAAGVTAEHLDGTMGKAEREGILARFRDGLATVVCNVNVLTEGFDLPAIEVIILARPTLSLGLYLQMVGRGMRPWPGKDVCRIHDHAGCILRHGVPDQVRDYSLHFDPRKAKKKLPPMRTCRFCFAVFAGAPSSCPACGEVLDGAGGRSGPEEIQGDRVRAIPIEQLRQQSLEFNEWMQARKRGAV
jgi:DNA repair protein RadD